MEDTQYFPIDGCPVDWATCTWNDIFILSNIEGMSCVFNTVFTLCLLLETRKWKNLNTHRRMALVQLTAFQITFLIHEFGTWVWLIQWTKVHPWDNWIGMVLGLHHSFSTSVVSIKASRMADILRGARSMRKMKGIGFMNKFSVFVSIVDPLMVVIYSIIYTGERMYEGWGIISLQNMVVNFINSFILILVCILIKFNKIPKKTVRRILVEMIVLQFCSWIVTILEYATTITGALIPLYIWYIVYNLEHAAAFFFRYLFRRAIQSTNFTQFGAAFKTKMSVMTSAAAVKTRNMAPSSFAPDQSARTIVVKLN